MNIRAGLWLSFALAANPFASSAQEWPHYSNDPGGSRYSPLKEINKTNVSKLKVAWTYHTGDISDGSKYPSSSAFECTPLVIDGVLYLTTPFARVIALEAETGKELWVFDPKLNRELRYNLFVNRGVSFWRNGEDQRIFLGTDDGRLFALNARTGKPVPSFGKEGFIYLREGVDENYPNATYGLTSPPAIYRDLVIVGSHVPKGSPQGPSGGIRAFDARSGKLVWRFNTVPRPGEVGNDTWEGDSWKNRGGVNTWSMMSVDRERGMVFAPIAQPATGFYGGDRKGANLFGSSVVALDAATGKRIWHFQTVHHDIWDWDVPAQPNLVNLRRDGKDIPAVAQVTKTGFLFVLDRLTGKPLIPVEERLVPQSVIPGEHTSPTQPIPVKPPPFARQTFSFDELTNVTPESRAECEELLKGAVTGPMFRPVGLEWTVTFPGTNGGANWGGASYDASSGLLFVNSKDNGSMRRMVKRPEGAQIPYQAQTRGGRFWDKNMYPCQKPPWAHLTAIDLNKGEFRWRVTLGVIDKLLDRGVPPTGTSNLGGTIVTAGGLVFIGATNDSRFRAFDSDTGKELWVTRLPASAHATPMTFRGKKTGKQFVVIAAGGGNKYNETFSDALIAFALP
jgi:quinoprotein glucose dehydrogenase